MIGCPNCLGPHIVNFLRGNSICITISVVTQLGEEDIFSVSGLVVKNKSGHLLRRIIFNFNLGTD